ADERHVGPAQPGARRVRGERGVQIVGHREPDVPNVVGPNAVQPDDGVEELERGAVDRLLVIPGDGRRAADAAHGHQPLPAAASDETNARRASGRRSAGAADTASSAALPTTTASATPRKDATCSGALMPKPTAMGSEVWRRTRATNSATSAPSARRAPVTPVSDTQYTNPRAAGTRRASRSS